jgi:hypothetical protein
VSAVFDSCLTANWAGGHVQVSFMLQLLLLHMLLLAVWCVPCVTSHDILFLYTYEKKEGIDYMLLM